MKLYQFSPIQNTTQLIEAMYHTHAACHALCKQALGTYLPIAGNIGIFCHYDSEYERLIKLQKELTDATQSINQKYYLLKKPIHIPANGYIPSVTYTYLYIRKPDPYRPQVGDVDFLLEPEKYIDLKKLLTEGAVVKGARQFPREDLDMIELYDPNIDAVAYIRTKNDLLS